MSKNELDKDKSHDTVNPQRVGGKRIGRCYEIAEKKKEDTFCIKTIEGFVIHYYIEMLDNKSVVLELVGENCEPTGKLIENISPADFSEKFKTCSHHICQMKPRTLDEISKKMAENRVEMGEKHLEKGELEEAEDKFSRALKYDEKSVRASLGMGKTKMEQDKVDEAMEIFSKLNEENAIYEQSNKHTLNQFGIYLRRKDLFDLAIDNYEKAISIDPKDEALYFNLGKAYAIKGSSLNKNNEAIGFIQKGIGILQEAICINEDFPEATEFLKKMIRKEKIMLDNLLKADDGNIDDEKKKIPIDDNAKPDNKSDDGKDNDEKKSKSANSSEKIANESGDSENSEE